MYAKWYAQCSPSTLFKDFVVFEEYDRKRNDKPSWVNEWLENCILAKFKLFSLFCPKKFMWFHVVSHDDLLSFSVNNFGFSWICIQTCDGDRCTVLLHFYFALSSNIRVRYKLFILQFYFREFYQDNLR